MEYVDIVVGVAVPASRAVRRISTGGWQGSPAGPAASWLTTADSALRLIDIMLGVDVPAGDLDVIPVGVQPEEDGRLLCRLCGRWYRALGHHLLRKHETTVEQYQERFELPAGRALAAADLREAQALRGSELLATVPAVRAGFLLDDQTDADTVAAERRRRMELANQGLAEKKTRAGVRASWVAHGQQIGEARRQWATGRREEVNAEARELGYADFSDFVDRTRHLTHPAFAQLLGWAGSDGLARATWWRLQYGGTSRAYEAAAKQRVAQQRAGLDQVPAGEQPVEDGQLRCLECGRWFVDLAQHVQNGHGRTREQYRALHGLPARTVLRGEGCRDGANARLAAQSRLAGDAAGRLKSEAARRRYDERARRLGYTDVVALLQAHTNAEVTALLGLGRGQAYRIRQRYLSSPGATGG